MRLRCGRTGRLGTPTAAVLAALLAFSGAKRISAQTAAAVLRGTVRDSDGAAIANARVALSADGQSQTTLTSITGSYSFASLDAGSYTLRVEAAGFQPASRGPVRLDASQDLVADFSLLRSRSESARDLGEIGFSDEPALKAAEIKDSGGAGGYSASAHADSYDLIVALMESEGPPEPSSGSKTASPESPASGGSISADLTERQLFEQGGRDLLHREYDAAVELFRTGVGRYPDSAKMQLGLGIALYARGQYDDAVKALLQATDLAPADPRPCLFLAKAYNASTTQADEVSKRLQRFVERQPQNAQAHYYYALSLWKGKGAQETDAGQIESLLKRSAALDPAFPDAHLRLGNLYAQQAKYAEAIEEYRQAVKLKPDLAEAHYRLAQALMRQGDKAAAQAELEIYERLHQGLADGSAAKTQSNSPPDKTQ